MKLNAAAIIGLGMISVGIVSMVLLIATALGA